MKRLDGYPYGMTAIKTPRMHTYENAAAKRKGQVTYVPGQLFQIPREMGKTQTYPTYKSPFINPFRADATYYDLAGMQKELPVVKEHQDGIPLPKLQAALQAYRVGSGTGIAPAVNVEAIVQSIISGVFPQEKTQLSKELVLKYSRKREEEIRTHEQDLWKRFRLQHMSYVESGVLFHGMRANFSGQIINLKV